MTDLRVRRVRLDVDMRTVHAVRQRLCRGLKTGEAALCVNAARTIARLIDARGGVHTYYADAGAEFDLPAIQREVGAMRLVLRVGGAQRGRLRAVA